MRTFTYTPVLFAIVVAALSGGCEKITPRTQVMLVVDADDEMSALITELNIDVQSKGSDDAGPGTSFQKTLMLKDTDAGTWPFEFALVPQSGDMSRTYHVVATALSGGEVVAVLRAESGFVPKKTLALRLFFEKSCLRKLNCMDTETCESGACASAVKDPTMLPAFGADNRGVNPPGGGTGAGTDGGLGGTGTITTGVNKAGSGGTGGGGVTTGNGGMSGMDSSGGGTGGVDDPLIGGDCGDGKLTGNETCDTAIPAGQSGACPTECRAASACELSQLTGTACRTRCVPAMITAFDSGDGCCPPGGDANSDTDCTSSCGNGSIEGGETCDPLASCPNPTTCKVEGNNKCLRARVIGDPDQCTSSCAIEPIEECKGGDGCCPAGCSSGNDNDCSASCGNGFIDQGELCEERTATPCPTNCRDNDSCTLEIFTGSAENCNSVCTEVPILIPFPGDGCCPILTGNANNDNDCQPVCGNRVVERGERCDGNCPNAGACNDGNACTRDGVTGNGCNVQCTHQAITNASQNADGCCPAGANANNDADCQPSCGNNVREDGELCDGNCPATCNDNNGCTSNTRMGDGCNIECSFSPDPSVCGSNSSCSRDGNTNVRCTCNAGFTSPDGKNCNPIPADPCAGVNCGMNSTCTGGNCACNPGFMSPNNRNCTPIDPCAGVDCGTNSTCTGGNCACNPGFMSPNNRNCTPIDPCAGVNCGTNSTCTGGNCACNPGFMSPNNRNCTPIDPCAGVNCGTNSTCTGGNCACNPGFMSPNNRNCTPIDPCAGVNCGMNSTCTGGNCACNPGFMSPNNRNCTPVEATP